MPDVFQAQRERIQTLEDAMQDLLALAEEAGLSNSTPWIRAEALLKKKKPCQRKLPV